VINDLLFAWEIAWPEIVVACVIGAAIGQLHAWRRHRRHG
jgi:hypothetical protein